MYAVQTSGWAKNVQKVQNDILLCSRIRMQQLVYKISAFRLILKFPGIPRNSQGFFFSVMVISIPVGKKLRWEYGTPSHKSIKIIQKVS